MQVGIAASSHVRELPCIAHARDVLVHLLHVVCQGIRPPYEPVVADRQTTSHHSNLELCVCVCVCQSYQEPIHNYCFVGSGGTNMLVTGAADEV